MTFIKLTKRSLAVLATTAAMIYPTIAVQAGEVLDRIRSTKNIVMSTEAE